MSQHSREVICSAQERDSGDFVRGFLFGCSDVYRNGTYLRAGLLMDLRTEGWIGIPHGGIGMGAIMELAMMLSNYPRNAGHLYPLSVDFRMGGSSVRIGDRMTVEVSEEESGARGIIYVERDMPPYVSASIRYRDTGSHEKDLFVSYIPGRISDIESRLMPLPHYKNCFVCGVERSHPGLKRTLHFLDSDESSRKIVVSTVGFDARDSEPFYLFHRNNIIHPIASMALLDETMGWAGFMASASGAVTVRISFTLYRDIRVGERVVAFGRGDKVRGNAGSRLLFWASGGAAAVNKDGTFETVIAASGQWLGVPALTRQMQMELMPKELTERAFRFADTL
jgi:acyl-coenzyme A thioesterase PaaI-like protein